MTKNNGLPRNVTEFQDRHGKWHLRYRAKGQPTHYFKSKPGTLEFREELDAVRGGAPTLPTVRMSAKTKPGTLSALIALYYSTPAYQGMKDSSKKTYRSVLERFREQHGTKMVERLQRKHIKAIIGAMSDRKQAANKLLAKIKILMALAVDEEWRKDNPAIGIKGYSRKTNGFHTWTEEEIATFEAKYSIGTTARTAFDIMLYTGQRRSDMRVAGRHNLAPAGRIRVKQQKTGAELSIGIHPNLKRSLEAVPRGQMIFVLTEYGKPFSAAGIGNKMRDWCDAAKLPICTAHGLRKAAARRLAEAGCSNKQIKAITGHVTDSEIERYTAAADQEMLADQAMAALQKAERKRKKAAAANKTATFVG